jgi:hypothetical protein
MEACSVAVGVLHKLRKFKLLNDASGGNVSLRGFDDKSRWIIDVKTWMLSGNLDNLFLDKSRYVSVAKRLNQPGSSCNMQSLTVSSEIHPLNSEFANSLGREGRLMAKSSRE